MATRLRAPGFTRAGAFLLLGVLFAAALVIVVRELYGYGTFDGANLLTGKAQNAILLVSLIAAPLFFLVGLGAFDYWFYWAAGRPTRPEDHSGHGAHSWRDYFKVNTDHKVIGIQYVVTSFFFMLVGGMLAMMVRAELATPGQQFVDANAYNGLFSVHASLMIFLFIIPVFAGLANFVLPLMIGAPDMAFPRLNALSFWMLPIAGAMMTASFFAPGGSVRHGLDRLRAAVDRRADRPDVLHDRRAVRGRVVDRDGPELPRDDHHDAGAGHVLLAHAAARVGELLDLAAGRDRHAVHRRLAVLRPARLRRSASTSSRRRATDDVLMYQHVFWFYSHPAVYIMMLPGFGIISEVLSVKSRKPIFGYRMMAFSLLAIVLLGFTVWAHHMFVSGMQAWIRIPMMVTTAIIAVPTGIKIFSWLATLWRGVLHLDTPMLWALGFLTMFTLGGISGVMLAMVPLTIHVSDTYFIVAHIHYVLFGGSLFTIYAGVYYWFPKMTGRMFDERLGKAHFWLTFVSFNATFAPMHLIGVQGMPRRVADYPEQFASWNLAISLASFVLGLSTLIFVYNMVSSWRSGPRASANPWRALTLEWQVSSPPPIFNFDKVPTVVGGPYEYGVPGAVHGIFESPAEARPKQPAGASTTDREGEA